MKIIPVILLILSQSLCADLGIIQDPDGFTNLRKGPDSKSEVVHKVLTNQVFHFFGSLDKPWIEVSLISDDEKSVSGYMHRSRILPFEKMVKLKQGKEISISYETQAFDQAAHKVTKNENGGVGKIDGHTVWGTDGGFPKTEITAVNLSLAGKKITVANGLFAGLYEPGKEFNFYQHRGVYFIHQNCSDGAGGYIIVWILQKDGTISRAVYSPF